MKVCTRHQHGYINLCTYCVMEAEPKKYKVGTALCSNEETALEQHQLLGEPITQSDGSMITIDQERALDALAFVDYPMDPDRV